MYEGVSQRYIIFTKENIMALSMFTFSHFVFAVSLDLGEDFAIRYLQDESQSLWVSESGRT